MKRLNEQSPAAHVQRYRHVFHIAGYDSVSAVAQHRRFLRQLTIFKQTWSVQASASELESSGSYPHWSVAAEGQNWRTAASVELLTWDDLVMADAQESRILRLCRALIAYINLLCTGTLFRYAIANQRYFLFAIAPLAETVLLGVVAWSVAAFVTARLGSPPLMQGPLALIGGFGLFMLLLEWPGRPWRIYQALDDWILSFDYVYGKRQDLETRLDEFAKRIVSEAINGNTDEIVVFGHSLGATFAIDAVARALALEPALGRKGPAFAIVTAGATIPKCALHPRAQRLRDQIKKVADEPSLHWVEFQSRADAISFYRFHPLTLRRITGNEELDARPLIRRVQIKDMLRPQSFAKYRLRVLRLHYQSVMANERRAPYDYFMMICGPLFAATWTESPLGLIDFFCEADNSVVYLDAEASS